ncbi:hypothetical protein [Nitrospira sp. BLG_1]|uniref:hypothetical protein n=1 Tax=Nitrospira sp. BLG_1 TaxID=3395883 RepID=UPI0039BD8C05
MNWPPWPKGNEKDLARYALPDVADGIRLAVGRDDLLAKRKHPELLRAIYEALLTRDIRYAREKFDPILEQQLIRHPEKILAGAGDATCLDLSLLFAGLCLGNELLPLVVVLDGHVFVVVSLVRDLRDAGLPGRHDPDRDGPWAAEGLLKDGKTLNELVRRGDYLPIECTGFAKSESINQRVPEGKGRTNDGQLTFDRAVEAGREQLSQVERAFSFAIDIAVLQNVHHIRPYETPVIRHGYVPPPETPSRDQLDLIDHLPVLCDRWHQNDEFNNQVVSYFKTMRSTRPVLVILPGPVQERHGYFLDRVKLHSLNDYLIRAGVSGERRVLEIRMALSKIATPERLRGEILAELQGEQTGGDDTIVSYIRQARLKALLVDIRLRASECEESPQKPLQLLADYLAAFPNTKGDVLLGAVVSLEENNKQSWWSKVRGMVSSTKSEIRPFDNSISKLEEQYRDGLKLHVRVLTRLTSPTEDDVRQWLGDKLVKKSISRVKEIEKSIKQIFNGHNSLPMDTLYPKLLDMLEKPKG